VQDEIDRLQAQPGPDDDRDLATLWARKKDLLKRIEALNT
jgi:hypothetical protein